MAHESRPVVFWMVVFFVCFALTHLTKAYPAATPWILLTAGLGLAAGTVYVVHRMRRNARDLSDSDAELRQVCPACGYDMRATPQRCPECGRRAQMTDPSPPPGFFDSQPRARRRR